jgi:tetratricopeptide (TPR) repeat protein
MLLLGDIALEWGTDQRIDAKLEEARETYATLIQTYGVQDNYLARMMRYFIRKDNLREVLPLKSHFMAQKKTTLDGQDLVELSGFLLEKLFGYLTPADEPLRVQIEDTHELLEMAIKAAPENPESRYNLGRYFVFTGNRSSAMQMLEDALPVFAASPNENRRTTEHHINAYRLLGELYFFDREYIHAEELYRNGLTIFESEAALHGFQSNSDVGNLYADLADIDYFISYDMDDALRNYQNAIDQQYDTPSVRYRIGYLNYTRGNYLNALGSFIKTMEEAPNDNHVLLALGNVLALRSDNYQAEAYLSTLLDRLALERARYGSVFPQVREDHYDLVDMYMKTANNLGVVLYRQTLQTGGSDKNAQALTWLSESLRAWDALTRNPQTMVRMEGSNLAERNISYITYPDSAFDPELYTAIPRILVGEQIPR